VKNPHFIVGDTAIETQAWRKMLLTALQCAQVILFLDKGATLKANNYKQH
jgi:hypothetical protein